MNNPTGKTIAGRYEVITLLGRGGMAEVYLANDTRIGAEVALKLTGFAQENSDLARRFLRGARLSRRVRHPNVTSTFDLGQWGQPIQGYYMVMEYVDGLSLGALLDVGLTAGAVCTLLSQVLAALAHVHAHGVLHRDIKPDNIMVYRRSDDTLHTKLTDFGIAASLSQDMNVTEAGGGVVVGTPAYMAPEQVQQCGVYAPALDLYAVGTTMYRLLSGTLPFSKTGMALLVARLTDQPAQLKARPGVPVSESVTAIVMKLLSPRPEDRYPLAADVIRELAPHCEPAVMDEPGWQSLRGGAAGLVVTGMNDADVLDVDTHGETVTFGDTGQITLSADTALMDNAPFWGREAFLANFYELIAAAEQGSGQVAMLSGPTGIGKTSIMERLAFSLAEQGRFIVLRTAYHVHGSVFSGLRYVFDKYLGTVGRSVDTVRHAALEFLRRFDDVDSGEADDLVVFLRPRTPTNSSDLGALNFNFGLATRMLRRISQVRPVLLVLDSMDQGESEAISFVSHLLFETRLEPFPILCMGAFCERTADASFIRTLSKNARYLGESFHRFEVPPLPGDVLAGGLAASCEVTLRTAEQIAIRAQGNPLFAVHLARAGTDALDGKLTGHHALSQQVDLPEQLARVLALSLDESLAGTGTPELLREVCRCVAILGDNVCVDLLRCYCDALKMAVDIDVALDPLIDVGLLVEGPIHGQERVALRPALLHDLLLGEMRPRKRRKLERVAADVRIEWAAAHSDAEAGAIGDHLEAAGAPESAVPWWRQSMLFEMLAGNPGQGVRAGLKALQQLDDESQEHADIAITTGRLLLDMGELTDAATVLAPTTRAANADNALRAGDVLADVYENAGRGSDWDDQIAAMSQRESDAGPTGLGALYCARSMWLNSRGSRECGFVEAQKAVEAAQPGREAQRAAQRLVYTCLSRGDLQLGEEAARKALEHAGEQPELRARSLRALGVVLVWQQRGADAIECFEALVKLARRYGFIARLPIAWHDLGEASRVSGQLTEARDAYDNALRTAAELALTSSVQLIQPKLIICDLLEGRTAGVHAKIERFVPSATASGLALAEPFGHMLSAWAYVLDGDLVGARQAYEAVSDMRDIAIDPQFPLIMERIGTAFAQSAEFDADEAYRQCAREALSLAAQFWMRYGQSERSGECEALRATL